MGINNTFGKFVFRHLGDGIGLGDVVTLGELDIHMDAGLLAKSGWKRTRMPRSFRELAPVMGSVSLAAIDASDYEGAEIIHDLNLPLPSCYEGKYDTVINGGTLEHIFNIPVAFDNMMKLCRVGGKIFSLAPANQLCGHGFYQFSPEFYYRVFSPEYGFKLIEMVSMESYGVNSEHGHLERTYSILDPASVGRRIELLTSYPMMLMVCAERIGTGESITVQPPQQSDYAVKWTSVNVPRGFGQQSAKHKPSWHDFVANFRRRLAKALLPKRLELHLMSYWQKSQIYTLRNKRYAKRVEL